MAMPRSELRFRLSGRSPRVVAAALVTIVAAGCGGAAASHKAARGRDGDATGPWGLFDDVGGSILFTCGQDPFAGDVYLKDAAGGVRRLTALPAGLGATSVSWHGTDVVFVSSRDGIATLQRLPDSGLPAVRGKVIDQGRAPASSESGVLAYTRLTDGKHGRLYDEVVRVDRQGRSVVARFHEVWSLHWFGDRLFTAATTRPGGRTALIDLGDRVHSQQRLPGHPFGRAAVSSSGRLASSYGGGRRPRLAIGRVGGQRYRIFRRRWSPLAWSPNSRQLLVQTVQRHSRLAILDPKRETLRTLGRAPCGYLSRASWTATARSEG
jgi:hypothetical protein